ncbi:TIGR00730 family Rossman fold protein [Galactobacillus timonensis]|uniref:LOG family protein n=1 Tax=Galactobacillus timonensis TaxID=2041840 RepID=UPI0024099C65|nr:TIGR00730 family Rossman fold protein [Galactobacillus timonensis]MDD6680498.1 TIGR00730 family Rossman fold protein [Galactobacillus timonensis]
MNITVFLGSTFGSKKQYASDAKAIGTWIGEHHHTLIYGGASVGTMGILSSAAKEAGAYVIGIMPQFLVDRGVANNAGLDEQIVVENMDERKKLLIGKADVLVTLPGGPGTLEELAEAVSAKKLGTFKGDVLIYNPDGFYNSLRAQYQHMAREGFLPVESMEMIRFCDSLDELLKLLNKM